MKLEEFDYNLPPELIAQTPLPNRSDSKLLVVDVPSKTCSHDRFQNLTDYLAKGDVLVLNDTSVIPARIIGTKVDTGAIIELLLLQDHGDNVWECLAKKARKIKVGTTITFGDGMLLATCTKVEPDGLRWFQLSYDGILFEILDQLGEMPLPPYIHETLDDPSRYQTVYNKHKGSAAAPTAGLHFTNELLDQLDRKGVIITYVTLHVGLGTFRPVQVEDIRDHQMHTEWYRMSKETAEILNNAATKQQRIIAVGTTSLRTLETVRRDYDTFVETTGWSDIFIYPGYEFKAIDNLITNFHLPKSTLLMLVSALAGKSLIMDAYQTAIEHHYRFFSFGDSMMIQRKK